MAHDSTHDVAGRVAIITGAPSRDLGSAAAERLHERGAVVAVNVRYAARAESVARDIGSLPLDLSGAPRAATARTLCKRYGASDP